MPKVVASHHKIFLGKYISISSLLMRFIDLSNDQYTYLARVLIRGIFTQRKNLMPSIIPGLQSPSHGTPLLNIVATLETQHSAFDTDHHSSKTKIGIITDLFPF